MPQLRRLYLLICANSFFISQTLIGLHFVIAYTMQETYKAIIMNDYKDAPYATWIKWGEKTIETRMKSFTFRGDIVICCGKTNSVGNNAGLALCLVELWKVRGMRWTDEEAAGVAYSPGRKSFLLRNWRHFSRDFEFALSLIHI